MKPPKNKVICSGTVAEWRDRVAALCVGNSRLVFAASCSFTEPLYQFFGVNRSGFGLAVSGLSGRIPALDVAGSVYGRTADLSCGEWRSWWPSTIFACESSIDGFVANFPADAGAGMGMFECLHGAKGAPEFSRRLHAAACAYFGSVGVEWLRLIGEGGQTFKLMVAKTTDEIVKELTQYPATKSELGGDVLARFALVGAAGELATAAGLTGWKEGESKRAAHACFKSFLATQNSKGGAV